MSFGTAIKLTGPWPAFRNDNGLPPVKGSVVSARRVRENLIPPGDLRNEIGFQNDINTMLATLDSGNVEFQALAPLLSPRHAPPAMAHKRASTVGQTADLLAVRGGHS